MATQAQSRQAAAGVGALRLLLVLGTLVTYGVLWIIVFEKVWNAGDGPAPKISTTLLYVIGIIGGVLATAFAAALGIERKDPARDPRKLQLGSTLVGTTPDQAGKTTAMATLAVWLYALIGAWAGLTVLVHQSQSPADVKAIAATFGTAVIGLVAGSLTPGNTV
jgi:hypothetical protein